MIELLTRFAAPCSGGSFFGIPPWYKYLDGQVVVDAKTKIQTCTPQIHALNDVWLIVAAVVEILLHIAAIAAVVFIITGGVRFILSQGEPDKTKQALSTIINAAIGLTISIAAATFITFVAGRFHWCGYWNALLPPK